MPKGENGIQVEQGSFFPGQHLRLHQALRFGGKTGPSLHLIQPDKLQESVVH